MIPVMYAWLQYMDVCIMFGRKQILFCIRLRLGFFAFAFEYLNVNGIRLNAYKEMKQFHLNIFS